MNENLEHRLDLVLQTIARAADKSGRSAEDVTLVAVSKGQPVEAIEQLAMLLEARGKKLLFGENYLQEWQLKKSQLKRSVECHAIGPLQSNKIRLAVQLFDAIQSIHNDKSLHLVEKEAKKAGKRMPVYLQVNISSDPNKSGFMDHDLDRVVGELLPSFTSVDFRGIMTITELYHIPKDVRPDFQKMRSLAERISSHHLNHRALDICMGMSADYAIAIEEGATHVRVGTAIFGERLKNNLVGN